MSALPESHVNWDRIKEIKGGYKIKKGVAVHFKKKSHPALYTALESISLKQLPLE